MQMERHDGGVAAAVFLRIAHWRSGISEMHLRTLPTPRTLPATAAHDGTLSDTVLSHAALGHTLQVEKEPSDEHPGASADAAAEAGGACKIPLEAGTSTFESAYLISAPCRDLCSKDAGLCSKDVVATDEGVVSTSCGDPLSEYTPLDSLLQEQSAGEPMNAGFAAYFWKDGIGEREISGSTDELSDASCQLDGDDWDGFTPLSHSMWPVPEDTESDEETANGTALPMMEVLKCGPSRKFDILLRLWDRRCNSYQRAKLAEGTP